MKAFDVALIERPNDEGLERSEVMDLYDMVGGEQVIPIEISNAGSESSAMGFIAVDKAEEIGYRYGDDSPLGKYIAGILADMNEENEENIYTFSEGNTEVAIWLSR